MMSEASASRPVTLSVIVVAIYEHSHLLRCLESFENQIDRPSMEILVVRPAGEDVSWIKQRFDGVMALSAKSASTQADMLDVVHHISRDEAKRLLTSIAETLPLGGVLILKDVDTHPAYKRWFTRALDWAMDPDARVNYWSAADLQDTLERIGFRVYRHKMNDVMPYPHVLYICSRTA